MDLVDRFNDHFEVVAANTKFLIDEAYRLRYQVYCEENAFEDPSRFPSRKETDSFDYRSKHCLVRHRHSGSFAAVVRLVLPDDENPHALHPIENHCRKRLKFLTLELARHPRPSLAEISRFAISKKVRQQLAKSHLSRRPLDRLAGKGGRPSDPTEPPLSALVILALFAGIFRMTMENDVKKLVAAMEPTLIRLLSRFGIEFRAVGPLIHYHGKRQPTLADAHDLEANIRNQRPDVWDFIERLGNSAQSAVGAKAKQFGTGASYRYSGN